MHSASSKETTKASTRALDMAASETGLKRFKKEHKQGSGKDDFGFREGLDFGNDFGGGCGGLEAAATVGLKVASEASVAAAATSGFCGGKFFGARSFDGGKSSSGSRHKEEKIEKIKTDKKHKAAAEVNADAKFKAAAAHETFHRNALLAKKIAAEKKKGGFNWLF
ncbi:hypothetical protein A4X06_0g7389 [Tilletia controversa]|uniref:Uncharacterized protein n=1 Tax=Tilletia controversa TaxID=13291 RepID=A0A8X7STR7_9BASI|nr:hypothetical protein A4X06_0g7389 [Tilletia controversa]